MENGDDARLRESATRSILLNIRTLREFERGKLIGELMGKNPSAMIDQSVRDRLRCHDRANIAVSRAHYGEREESWHETAGGGCADDAAATRVIERITVGPIQT
jgi:hypothetical protein